MSKPDPSITAKLLSSLNETSGEPHGHATEKNGAKPHLEADARPCPASVTKLGMPSRKHSGAGHMRSSNRGK